LSDAHRFFYLYAPAAVLLLILVRRNVQSADAAIRFEEESEKAPICLDLKIWSCQVSGRSPSPAP